MADENVATMIKHLATYLPIYEFVRDGAKNIETIKRHLMVEYDKPESTARAQVNAIDDSPLFIKERGVVSINKEAALELELWLNYIFSWESYDSRYHEIESYREKISELKKEIRKANEKLKDKEETINKLELQVYGSETEAIRESFARKDMEDKYEKLNRELNEIHIMKDMFKSLGFIERIKLARCLYLSVLSVDKLYRAKVKLGEENEYKNVTKRLK